MSSRYSWNSPQRTLWRQKKVAVVERFKQESMYGLSAWKNGRCEDVAVSGGSTVYTIVKAFPFSFLLRLVAVLANKVNSESQQTATFKFQVCFFATIQNIKYLNKKSPAWRENPRETTGPLN